MPAERGEIVQSQQRSGRHGHRVDIQWARPRRDETGVLGFGSERGQRQAVGVMAPQCREPGVETRGRPNYPAHPDIGRQEAGKPTNQCGELRFAAAVPSGVCMYEGAAGNVDVRHLAGGVHPGVGTSGCEQAHR
jgi:hypothetical protein